MLFRVRLLKPRQCEWREVEDSSPEDAANQFHYDLHESDSIVYRWAKDSGGVQFVGFALVEVEGHGEFVSRWFRSGLFRKGGVARNPPITLQNIADRLGYTHPPETLLEDGWEGEETFDQARARKSGC